VTWIANCFRRGGAVILGAALTISTGCRSTDNSSGAGTNGQNYSGVWKASDSQPQKSQTVKDFIGQPRPDNF
jgi:hypothetical protein